jgi:pimeloyl-ACP methyl ester carboxylesterase
MWPIDEAFVESWRAACATDAVLNGFAGPWDAHFAIAGDGWTIAFSVTNGVVQPTAAAPDCTFAAPDAAWTKFLAPVPERHHHVILAMLARVPGCEIRGDMRAFMQHCHLVRRVLEIGKWLALGHALPVPPSLRPASPPRIPSLAPQGGYVTVGSDQVFFEWAGTGQDMLCLHTAGADARQFHGLMRDPSLTATHRLVAFDMPWHGRSTPPAGHLPGGWKLTTSAYVDIIMGFIAAAGLRRPIVLGASMSGEICLELALRYPEAFRAIIACEASDNIQGRQTPWAWHPQINQTLFVPEWIHGLMAPQSPAESVAEVLWHYGQGGPGVFRGDIHFYAGEWDARDRVAEIDTSKCPLFMLTGEYDYSCTAEMSEATAAKIPGARFQRMNGIGHFPFAENPALFTDYLRPILQGK